MAELVSSAAKYRYLAERSGSCYRELFVNRTSVRAQSLISDMENEGLSAEQIAEVYHIPLDAVTRGRGICAPERGVFGQGAVSQPATSNRERVSQGRSMTCYLDDDVDQDLLIRLAVAHSHRLISPRSLGQSGQHDALHFLYAVSQRTPLMTRNANDFEALHEFALGAG